MLPWVSPTVIDNVIPPGFCHHNHCFRIASRQSTGRLTGSYAAVWWWMASYHKLRAATQLLHGATTDTRLHRVIAPTALPQRS